MTLTPHGATHTGCRCTLPAAYAALADVGTVSPVELPPAMERRPANPARAELIVTGRIITMDTANPVVEAVAVSEGRIAAVGSRSDIDGLRGPGTDVVDIGDHVAYPGLVEPHMHYWSSALFHGWADVNTRTGRTYQDVLEVLAGTEPIGGWVLGNFYDPALLPGEPKLLRDDLDRIHPDTPVFVMNASMHWAYVNSAALEAADITDDVSQPEGGIFDMHDGRLTGAIGEMGAMAPFMAVLPQKSQADLEAALVQINHHAAARGYTRTHDAGTGGLFGIGEPQILHGLSDRLHGRISMAILDQAAEEAVAQGLRGGDGDDMVRVTHWKLVGDGSNQGYSGYQKNNYLGKDFRGEPNYSVDHLVNSVRTGHEHGFSMMIHANGDAAVTQAVDAYEQALDGTSGLTHRDRIEHCSFATQDDLQRMARLGLSPSFLVGHVYYWGHAFRDTIMGAQKAARLDPVASALALGLRSSTHSDYTVTPFEPMQELQTVVTRVLRDGGDVLGPDERIPVDQAIRLKTVDAAWQVHADDEGTLEPGTLADLTILDRDPQQVNPSEIADLQVVRTIVGGSTVHEG